MFVYPIDLFSLNHKNSYTIWNRFFELSQWESKALFIDFRLWKYQGYRSFIQGYFHYWSTAVDWLSVSLKYTQAAHFLQPREAFSVTVISW